MKTLTLDLSGIYATVPAEAVEAWREKSDQYQHQLHTATGLGNDFLGWINLPNEISDADFSARRLLVTSSSAVTMSSASVSGGATSVLVLSSRL